MAYAFLVQFLILSLGYAKIDRILSEGYLGEKRLDSYSDRYQPLIFHDIYKGKLVFQDDLFFRNYFQPYVFEKAWDMSFFLKSELGGSLTCPNALLSEHFDDIQYSYRLITLSYLLEGQWHLNMVSDHLGLKKGCHFDLKGWLSRCKPKSESMKKFIARIKKYQPSYEETLNRSYKKQDWLKDFKKKDFKFYSHYRMNLACGDECGPGNLEKNFNKSCLEDQELMTLLCSEEDEVLGLSNNRDAYYLIGLSNIINTYNKNGEATGCLRRFSEVMSHKEVHYPVLNSLFPVLRAHLVNQYKERFLQGRVFFYGSSKEFEEKGVKNLFVMEQPLKIEKLPKEEPIIVQPKIAVAPKEKEKKKFKAPVVVAKEVKVKERKPQKSAFLKASDTRRQENLEMVEVDMNELKYDYVFSLNMINNLSSRLKSFMTRDALVEMTTYDKLGTKEGPVPLLFIKFMIDMEEHTGLFNLINVLGDKFYVSNEIDTSFRPEIEYVQLVNNELSGRQWQLRILKP